MMEGQAYIVALILMIASPLAIASDEGQAVLERFDRTPDDQVYDVANNRIDMLDELDDSILNDRPNDMDIREVPEDCYTLEQWKERLAERDWNKEDWEQESNQVREEKDDGARGNSDAKEEKENDEDKKDYDEKETDKVIDKDLTKTNDKDCFTEAEFEAYVDKTANKDSVDRDCVTVGQVREKWERIREGARDRDDDEDEREDDEDEDSDRARGEDQLDDEDDDEVNEEKAELVAVIGELKEACEGGDEAACLELEELLEEYWKDWEQDKERDWVQEDRDDSECVGKHMMDRMKEKFGRDRGEKDRDRNYDHDWERDDDKEWEELRAFMAELGAACDEGDEEACEELEEWVQKLENDEQEREEECDEHDDESEEEDEEENWDDDDEDDSEDDEPEEA